MKYAILFGWTSMFITWSGLMAHAQETTDVPFKETHAEPLYIDLIRDLGALKGERELNVAFGLTDKLDYDEYEALVEYEWAPVNRLGLEVEIPFTFYSRSSERSQSNRPSHRIESLKTAIQWSFFVSKKRRMSMALGYINEVVITDLDDISFSRTFDGNVFNPFFVFAKRLGRNFHSLLYTGPVFERLYSNKTWDWNYQINQSFHFLLPGTRHFMGVELNALAETGNFHMVIRPQMRLEISRQIMIGIVGGIPISKTNERLSSFVRLIYEPAHKK